jgi:hypothetical protein
MACAFLPLRLRALVDVVGGENTRGCLSSEIQEIGDATFVVGDGETKTAVPLMEGLDLQSDTAEEVPWPNVSHGRSETRPRCAAVTVPRLS